LSVEASSWDLKESTSLGALETLQTELKVFKSQIESDLRESSAFTDLHNKENESEAIIKRIVVLQNEIDQFASKATNGKEHLAQNHIKT